MKVTVIEKDCEFWKNADVGCVIDIPYNQATNIMFLKCAKKYTGDGLLFGERILRIKRRLNERL